MNGILSQMLSLISYGNQYLNNKEIDSAYYPSNVAFKFCNQVRFLHLDSTSSTGETEKEVAPNPISWFDHLKNDNCRELKAYYHPSEDDHDGTPDYKLAGFVGGGGTWLIEAIYPTYSDFWASRWENNQPDDPDRNIWSVSYGRTISATETINFCQDVDHIRVALDAILRDIQEFAADHKFDNWSDVFKNALAVLNGNRPVADWYHDVISEKGYSNKALQLIHAAMTAHVFGGMGSWNDLGFSDAADQETYEELSYYLYDNINRALLSGINSINSVEA